MQIYIFMTVLLSTVLSDRVREYMRNPLSEVNVFVNAPMVDVLDMKETLRRRRLQKEMIRNME